jgi:hypothetical protein
MVNWSYIAPQVERGVSARNPCDLLTLHINSQRKTLLHPTLNIRIAGASGRTETVRSTCERHSSSLQFTIHF